MYELTDKHGNTFCFEDDKIVGIKCKWRNVLKIIVAESFNESLKENTDLWYKKSISAVVLTSDDISEITEGDNVYFYSNVEYDGLTN